MDDKNLHPEKDLYINYDLWRSGARKLLFVTGLSGSGKSTLTRYISSKYGGKEGKCIYIPLDIFFRIPYYAALVKGPNPENPGVSKFLIDFARAYGYGDVDSEDPTWFIASSKMVSNPYSLKVKDMIQYVTTKRNDIRVILEGVQLFDVQDLAEIVMPYPIVIKAVPTYQAITRALKRNYKSSLLPALLKDIKESGGSTLSWYIRSRKRLNVLIDKIRQSVDSAKIQEIQIQEIQSYQSPM